MARQHAQQAPIIQTPTRI